jgi:hypothetical protein
VSVNELLNQKIIVFLLSIKYIKIVIIMKTIITIFAILLSTVYLFSQDTIMVTLADEESDYNGEYVYTEMLNSKKVFSRTVNLGTESESTAKVAYIETDTGDVVWAILIDDELLCYSIVVPQGVMPPFEGWEAESDEEIISIYYEPENEEDIVVLVSDGDYADCSPASGVYHFEGVLNAKNYYLFPITYESDEMVLGIAYNETRWELYNVEFDTPGFANYNVSTSLLPPNTGWENVPGGCDGELMIQGGYNLEVASTDLEPFTIHPNPATSKLFLNNTFEDSTYQIIDLNGRVVLTSTTSNSIDVSHLEKGVYFIKNELGAVRFIKN